MKFITQAAKVLNEQKKYKRRLAVFLCLAVVVALGTAAALKMYGQAMSHKQKKLVCRYAAHVHTDECFDGEAVVCGYADYAVHLHNDDCYGPNGELVCHLPEAEAHVHTEECYTEQEVLICEEEETQAHEHTEGCYTPERGELSCQMEEHMHEDSCYGENGEIICPLEEHQHDDNCYQWKEVLTCTLGAHEHTQDCYTREMRELSCNLEEHEHGEACYDENGELVCQLEEHTHDDDCYVWEDVLTCQLEESDGGHVHGDGCYEMQKVLSCGKLELHTHDDSCYDENGALTCGLLQLEEHVHGEDCFETVELTEEEIIALSGAGGESVSGDAVSGDSVSGDSVSADEAKEAHEHTEECYDADGMLICEYKEAETEEPSIIKTYEDEKYIVTASYHNDAEIPEDAELKAEMITAETDGEHYAEREAEIRKTLEDENLTMNALLKIGFYKDNEEIEPKSDVTLTVQFLDEKGLAEGSPVAVVHFSDGGSQVLNGGEAKNKSTTFKTKSFSEFGIIEGYKVEEPEKPENGADNTEEPAGIPVAQTYEYQNDAYHITFHISGNAVLLEDKDDTAKMISFGDEDKFIEVDDASVSEDENTIKDTQPSAESENSTDEDKTVSENESRDEESNAEGELIEETESSDEIEDGSETADENSGDESVLIEPEESDGNSDFNLKVRALAEDSAEHMAAQEYMDEETDKLNAQSEQLMLQTISYSLMYKGVEMELSGCEIEAEIEPSEELIENAESETDNKEKKASVSFTVMGISQENQVSEIETISIEEGGKTEAVRVRLPSAIKTVSAGASSRENVNPRFKVEYYAYVKVPVITEDDPKTKPVLELLDTDNGGTGEGGKLPTNRETKIGNAKVMKLSMEGEELAVGQKYQIQYEEKLMKIFESQEFNFMNYPQLKYVNKFKYKVKTDVQKPEEPEENPDPHYNPSQIWVDKTGSSDGNDDWNDWEKLDYLTEGDLEITNNAEQADDKHILISELENGKMPVIRFVCRYNEKNKDGERFVDPVDFYDYDITDGKIYGSKDDCSNKISENALDRMTETRPLYMNVGQEGINKDSCGLDLQKYTYAVPGCARFGFGNGMNSAGVMWDNCLFNNFQINQANLSSGTLDNNGNAINAATVNDRVYGMCSFGLVQNKLKDDGYPAFAEGIVGPDLFSPAQEDGKKRVTGYSLNFNRAGDTYILNSLYNSEAAPDATTKELSALDQFTYTKPQWTLKTPIYSNSFWPMDFSKTYNADGHDYKFGSGKEKLNACGKVACIGLGPTDQYPDGAYPSDEGIDHNSFFGMTFAVNFELTKDYCGLLDYYFFGDDDMWVYLIKKPEGSDPGWSKLVCDIGGVHSAVGEYVNLWDWITKGEVGKDGREGKYALKFFYTERGASGSTCWMQYTLPSASIQPVDQTEEQDELTIRKTVQNSNTNQKFEFKVTLNAGTGNRYPYVIKNEKGEQVGSGDITDGVPKPIYLQKNQAVTIMHLPPNAKYTVEEAEPDSSVFETPKYIVNGGERQEGYKAEGELDKSRNDIVEYINTARNYELPETGGSGNLPVYTAVLAFAGAALLLGYRQYRYREEGMRRRK